MAWGRGGEAGGGESAAMIPRRRRYGSGVGEQVLRFGCGVGVGLAVRSVGSGDGEHAGGMRRWRARGMDAGNG